ncbi:MAG: hypothetical protein ACM3N9_03935 [Syntrophothermus sp.]
MKIIQLNESEIEQIISFYEQLIRELDSYEAVLHSSLGRIHEQNDQEPVSPEPAMKLVDIPVIPEKKINPEPEKEKFLLKQENRDLVLPKSKKKKEKRLPKGMIIMPYLGKNKKIRLDEYGMPYYEKNPDQEF